MKILFATSNQHKLAEVQSILEPNGIEVVGLNAIETAVEEPIEDSDTFAGNAKIKATGYAKATGKRCMADDSGLVVDALGGDPGVYSARFAGIGSTRKERDSANNELLLEKLRGVLEPSRSARFICAICIADPDGTIVAEADGAFEGVIADSPSGENGFGYDPLLFLPSIGKTIAELSPKEKNMRSHRGQAVQKILKLIEH
ncbi:MAG: RdgB/HAM1 family non-canonical purine NTP pyrophosphatase [Phycisphaerales bacterium]|nr:RdgB/HAM1 family non-canonical purine NTP pyrophosphatase [Phycisphaerales bacterium]